MAMPCSFAFMYMYSISYSVSNIYSGIILLSD